MEAKPFRTGLAVLMCLITLVIGVFAGAIATWRFVSSMLRDVESSAMRNASCHATVRALRTVGVLWDLRTGRTNEAIEKLEMDLWHSAVPHDDPAYGPISYYRTSWIGTNSFRNSSERR